jgi:pectin methylesterase-like acyl-CoA thioesterase
MRSSKLMRRLGPALLGAGAMLGLLVGGPELAAQRTITVCSSGCDYATIQQAIDAASAGDTIEVRAGTYLENLTIRDKQDLILQGAGRDQVTLDGSLRAAERDIIPGILILNSKNITVRGFKIINTGGAPGQHHHR